MQAVDSEELLGGSAGSLKKHMSGVAFQSDRDHQLALRFCLVCLFFVLAASGPHLKQPVALGDSSCCNYVDKELEVLGDQDPQRAVGRGDISRQTCGSQICN